MPECNAGEKWICPCLITVNSKQFFVPFCDVQWDEQIENWHMCFFWCSDRVPNITIDQFQGLDWFYCLTLLPNLEQSREYWIIDCCHSLLSLHMCVWMYTTPLIPNPTLCTHNSKQIHDPCCNFYETWHGVVFWVWVYCLLYWVNDSFWRCNRGSLWKEGSIRNW